MSENDSDGDSQVAGNSPDNSTTESVKQQSDPDKSSAPFNASKLVTSRVRITNDIRFRQMCVVTASASVLILVFLLGSILVSGLPALSWKLLTGFPEPEPENAGMWPALMGTLWVCTMCALITLPLGIGTAILLEEFTPRNKLGRKVLSLIQLNITNTCDFRRH